MAGILTYTGTPDSRLRPEEPDAYDRPYEPYLADPALVEAVNVAILLHRPLLIRGEPGCGKTRLAQAVAHELNLPDDAWHINSTSRAQDGRYFYDAIARLRDAQLAAHGGRDVTDISQYIRLGKIGKAFRSDKPMVLLIDEIDKADIDFPNDLLLELDQQWFVVEETGEKVKAKHPPIVFITSNDERELPDAFLRRCLFHYIEFPTKERLLDIVLAHFPDADLPLTKMVVQRFHELRQDMAHTKGSGKKVSTSELLDWFMVLQHHREQASQLQEGKLPFASVLLKSVEDHRRYLDGKEHA